MTLKNWRKEFGSAPPFMICANTIQVSIKKEKKGYLHPIKKNQKKKKKKRKESKMKINTELVGEKVPEKKRCPLFTIFFRARYFVYI